MTKKEKLKKKLELLETVKPITDANKPTCNGYFINFKDRVVIKSIY